MGKKGKTDEWCKEGNEAGKNWGNCLLIGSEYEVIKVIPAWGQHKHTLSILFNSLFIFFSHSYRLFAFQWMQMCSSYGECMLENLVSFLLQLKKSN